MLARGISCLLFTVALGALLAAPASAQPQAPVDTPGVTVVVEPSTDLVGGTPAVVTGAGFPEAASLLITQCLPAADTADDCDIGGIVLGSTADDGTFTADFNISSRINPRAARGFDCSTSAEPCVIIAVDAATGIRARAAVTFDPDGVLPSLGTLVLSPSIDLVDRQVIDASLTFSADLPGRPSFVELRQCRADTDAACTEPVFGFVTDFADPPNITRLRRFLTDGFDCASAPGACIVEASDPQSERITQAPLSFDPSVAAVQVAATVEPATNLPYFAPVIVRGTDWLPDDFIGIQICVSPDIELDQPRCRRVSIFTTDAEDSGDGSFTAAAVLPREIDFNFDGDAYDCAVGAGCVIQVESENDPRDVAEIPVTFDPSTVAPTSGTVSVAPAEALPFVAEVAVAGAFSMGGNGNVQFFQCPASAVAADNADNDDDADNEDAGPNRNDLSRFCRDAGSANSLFGRGGFAGEATLAREFASGGGFGPRVDCLAESCVVTVTGFNFDNGSTEIFSSAPIRFDPDAPAPPGPTIEALPSTGLRDLDVVSVTGAGNLEAGTRVSVRQCIATSCYGGFNNGTLVDDDGTFATSLAVRRVIDTYGGPADCATEFDCEIQVQTQDPFGTRTTSIPLDFDPDVPAVDRRLEVTETDDLRDGDEVTFFASGVTPGERVVASQCAIEADQEFSCIDYFGSTNNGGIADATGSFTFTLKAQRDLYAGLDPIDCTEVRCVINFSTTDVFSSLAAVGPFELSFNRSIPFAPVTLEVTPTAGLVDGQRLDVVGSGWPIDGCCARRGTDRRPGNIGDDDGPDIMFEGSVGISQCAIVDGQRPACFEGIGIGVQSDGTFVGEAFARRFIGGYDCLEVECRLVVGTSSNATGQFFVASQVLRYAPDDLVVIPGLAFVNEGDPESPVGLPVVLSRAVDQEVTVSYRLVGFGAEAGADFVDESGLLTFAPGQTEATVPIEVIDDAAAEGNEAVLVGFGDPSLGSIGGFGFGGLVIVDNDSAAPPGQPTPTTGPIADP